MTDTHGRTRTLQHVVCAVLLVLTLSSTTEAGPLEVKIDTYPVILAGFIASSYNAATQDFLATGWALSLNQGSGAVPYSNTRFELTAKINNSGIATSGTLNVGAGTLLSSVSLVNFGFYAVPGGTMEFLFGAPTGNLVPGVFVGTPDKPIDVMLTGVGSAFTGSWATSWTSTANASAAIRQDPVPEPSVLLLTLIGAGALGARRASRRRAA
jgi:hypothetical protein